MTRGCARRRSANIGFSGGDLRLATRHVPASRCTAAEPRQRRMASGTGHVPQAVQLQARRSRPCAGRPALRRAVVRPARPAVVDVDARAMRALERARLHRRRRRQAVAREALEARCANGGPAGQPQEPFDRGPQARPRCSPPQGHAEKRPVDEAVTNDPRAVTPPGRFSRGHQISTVRNVRLDRPRTRTYRRFGSGRSGAPGTEVQRQSGRRCCVRQPASRGRFSQLRSRRATRDRDLGEPRAQRLDLRGSGWDFQVLVRAPRVVRHDVDHHRPVDGWG